MARREPPITPLKVPKGVRTVVVFGGVFDPPHIQHVVPPLMVANALFADKGWLVYVPAAKSPLKRGPVASDEQRLAMLKLALDMPGRRSIWTDEIDRAAWLRQRGRGEASYTIDTLKRLRRIVPRGVTLRLLVGSDQVGQFHLWKDYRVVVRLAEPLVMAREPVISASSVYSALDDRAWTGQERAAWCSRLAPNMVMIAASRDIRTAIAGAPSDARRWRRIPLLDSITLPVAKYIVAHNLYGFRPGPVVSQDAAAARSASIGGSAGRPSHAIDHLLEGLGRAASVLRARNVKKKSSGGRRRSKRPR